MSLYGIRQDRKRPPIPGNCGVTLPEGRECVGLVVVGQGQSGIKVQRLAIAENRIAGLACLGQDVAKVDVRCGVVGLQFQQAAKSRRTFVEATKALQRDGQIAKCLDVVGAQVQQRLEMRGRFVKSAEPLQRNG